MARSNPVDRRRVADLRYRPEHEDQDGRSDRAPACRARDEPRVAVVRR